MLGLLTLVLGVVVVVSLADPGVSGEALVRAVVGGLTALGWAASAVGVGRLVLGRARLVVAFAAGLAVLGLTLLPLAVLDLLAWGWVVAAAGLLGWTRGGLEPEERPGSAVLVVAAVVAVAGGLDALAPPVDVDEIYYHLAVPQALLESGLTGGPWFPEASRPLPLALVWAAMMAVGGEAAPKLFHLVLVGGLVWEVRDVGRRELGPWAGELAALALLGSWSFVRESGLAYNDLPTALLALCALRSCLAGRTSRMALFAGAALATKYTAAGVVTAVYLLALWRGRRTPKATLVAVGGATAAALALVAPWWLRNLAEGHHPLFPYAGWPELEGFAYLYLEKYGAGREPFDFVAAAWRAFLEASPRSYTFLGRLNPVLLVLAPAAAWAALRGRARFAWLAVPIWLAWLAGPHSLRYLLPGLPVLALAAGEGLAELPRLGRVVVWLVWFAGLPSNVGPWLGTVADRAAVAVGAEEREDFLARRVMGWEALAWTRDHAPADARVALLYTWGRYYVGRPWVLGSVEDHTPTRYLVRQQGERALPTLAEAGVTHVVVGEDKPIRKVHRFLDDAAWREAFLVPREQVDRQLLGGATLVYRAGDHGVWRLLP